MATRSREGKAVTPPTHVRVCVWEWPLLVVVCCSSLWSEGHKSRSGTCFISVATTSALPAEALLPSSSQTGCAGQAGWTSEHLQQARAAHQ